MINFLRWTESPQFNTTVLFEILRDFRKGGINPTNFAEFIAMIESLPPVKRGIERDYSQFNKLGLSDIRPEEMNVIIREAIRRSIEKSKKCWHPLASNTTCDLNVDGSVRISAAHSVQNNGILNQIAENGHVMTYEMSMGELTGGKLGKNHASVFWGFCNTHDAIFRPIEVVPYTCTEEQNFLFAYRGFVVAAHSKIQGSTWVNFEEQSNIDIQVTKRMFDDAIINSAFDEIQTDVFEFPAVYPIAASSSFYLDYDFIGNPIPHSDSRMENIYVSIFPQDRKTVFLISYFKEDERLYGNLGNQLKKRDNLFSDITILLAGHVENIYFNPLYYKTFIEKYENELVSLIQDTQLDFAFFGEDNTIKETISLTPSDYLANKYGINFFGYGNTTT